MNGSRQIGKIVLCGLNARYVHTSLALRSLVRYVRTAWARTDVPLPELILHEGSINEQTLSILARLARDQADVYAFSCYIWNIGTIRHLCRALKKVRPNAQIVWGGPEAGYQATLLLHAGEPADLIISGEGESAFLNLLYALADHNPAALSAVPNLTWRDQSTGEIRSNPAAHLLAGSEWPFPYTNDDLKIAGDRILYYESSRGCPFCCTYCLSSLDRTVRYRPLEMVFPEIDCFLAANVLQVKWVDRTFNSNPERAFSIWQYLISRAREQSCRTNFHFEVAGDLLDDAAVDLLLSAPPGLIQLEIGVQTIQPEILRTINRISRLDVLARQVGRLRAGGNIHLHLDLIAGLPGESLVGVAATFNWIAALRPHNFQLGFLKVLPGTPMAEQAAERGYRWMDEPPYEVLSSDRLDFDDLCRLKRIEAVLNLYQNSGFFGFSLRWLIGLWPDPFAFFDDLGGWFDQHDGLDRAIGHDERGRLLHQFALAHYPGLTENTWLAGAWLDLLRLDYLGSGQKDRPDWLNFWETRQDPIEKNSLRQAKLDFRQSHPESRRFQLDRLSFDWDLMNRQGLLVPGSWLVAFERSGLRPVMVECRSYTS